MFIKTIEYGFDFVIDYDVTDDWNTYFVTSFYNREEETNLGVGLVSQTDLMLLAAVFQS